MDLYKRRRISLETQNTSHGHEMLNVVDAAQRNRTKIYLQKVFTAHHSLRIENEIFSKFSLKSAEYEMKAKDIRANINLKRNFVLYHQLVSEHVSFAYIVGLTSREMAPLGKKEERG